MDFCEAKVADILRANQRDEAFVKDLESQLHSFLKYLNARTYHKIRRSVPVVANLWYYYMTSLGNLQTLGEEYSGILRISSQNKITSNLRQTVWLILYIGGEPLLERVFSVTENKIKNSPSLTQQAKDVLLRCIQVFKDQKQFFNQIHHSLFYIDGRFYNIANRLLGIKYVLIRQWLQDESFTGSFRLLGQLSLFYILFNAIQNLLNQDFSVTSTRDSISITNESTKGCVLCADNLKYATATPCGHIFCWDCIHDSLNYQKNCPVCREEVIPNRVIFLQNYI